MQEVARMSQDTWVKLDEAEKINGRTGDSFLKRVELGKVRSKSSLLSRQKKYSRDDAQQDMVSKREESVLTDTENSHDQMLRNLSGDVAERES